MSRAADRACEWVYRGVWGALARRFRVPEEPPSLPVRPGEEIRSTRPAPGYLRYVKFKFWIVLLLIDGALTALWVGLLVNHRILGLAMLPVYLAVAIVPDVIAYVAIHLRYDTTWYVFTPRSLRIRRGIWTIRESTITFENVQNVAVRQGPLQRHFGVADLHVQTAGGGGGAGPHGAQAGAGAHHGLIEGVDDAPALRDAIMRYVTASRSAGLGDERDTANFERPGTAALRPAHRAMLREIREAARVLHAAGA
ncbi:MAG TPA: PH domain-containing protein [Phycisphaerales bacterium]|nr:PH domain-containing protein [Phycisphaerales bacterium]